MKPNFSGNICFLLSFVCRTERKHWRKLILKYVSDKYSIYMWKKCSGQTFCSEKRKFFPLFYPKLTVLKQTLLFLHMGENIWKRILLNYLDFSNDFKQKKQTHLDFFSTWFHTWKNITPNIFFLIFLSVSHDKRKSIPFPRCTCVTFTCVSPAEAGSAGSGRSWISHILTLPSSEHDMSSLKHRETLKSQQLLLCVVIRTQMWSVHFSCVWEYFHN